MVVGDGGREHLNFSEYEGFPTAEAFQRVVEGGEMPPMQYTLIHPDAKLTDAEKQTLVEGYAAVVARGASRGETPTSSPAPSPTSTADAVAVIDQVCSRCHSADPALSFHAGSAAEAQALIDAMIQRGAQVTAEQEQILIQYFTR
jgi:hypothetical protein